MRSDTTLPNFFFPICEENFHPTQKSRGLFCTYELLKNLEILYVYREESKTKFGVKLEPHIRLFLENSRER